MRDEIPDELPAGSRLEVVSAAEHLRWVQRVVALEEQVKRLEEITTAPRWLDVEGASTYTTLAKSTIEKYVSARSIPFHRIPGSRRIVFSAPELNQWLSLRVRSLDAFTNGGAPLGTAPATATREGAPDDSNTL